MSALIDQVQNIRTTLDDIQYNLGALDWLLSHVDGELRDAPSWFTDAKTLRRCEFGDIWVDTYLSKRYGGVRVFDYGFRVFHGDGTITHQSAEPF